MILSAHFLVGGVIAAKSQIPILGILLAFLSHYLFDLLPVKEYDISTIYGRQWRKSFFDFSKVFLDILLGVLLVLMFSENLWIGLIGGFFAMVPDALTLLFILFPKSEILNWHYQIHKNFNYFKNKKIPTLFGIATEALVYLMAILYLFSPQ